MPVKSQYTTRQPTGHSMYHWPIITLISFLCCLLFHPARQSEDLNMQGVKVKGWQVSSACGTSPHQGWLMQWPHNLTPVGASKAVWNVLHRSSADFLRGRCCIVIDPAWVDRAHYNITKSLSPLHSWSSNSRRIEDL